jgi:hypothetical protein
MQLLGDLKGPTSSVSAALGQRATAIVKAHVSMKGGFGTANTAVVFFDGMLWALNEADLPYWVSSRLGNF